MDDKEFKELQLKYTEAKKIRAKIKFAEIQVQSYTRRSDAAKEYNKEYFNTLTKAWIEKLNYHKAQYKLL